MRSSISVPLSCWIASLSLLSGCGHHASAPDAGAGDAAMPDDAAMAPDVDGMSSPLDAANVDGEGPDGSEPPDGGVVTKPPPSATYYTVAGHRLAMVGQYKDDLNQVILNAGQPIPVNASIWYPTTAAGANHTYVLGYDSSGDPNAKQTLVSENVAMDAPIAAGTFPLVFFAHGDTGCGAQAIFLTEELARHGYIVVAPDFNDAGCSEAAVPLQPVPDANTLLCPSGMADACFTAYDPGFLPAAAGMTTYQSWRYRYYESQDAIAWTLSSTSGLAGSIAKDASNAYIMGVVGHSLGGYTAFNLVGGWPSWKDSRFRTAVFLSPWIIDKLPYKVQGGATVAVGNPANWLADPLNTTQSTDLPGDYIDVPVQFQGGDKDTTITPWICADTSGTCTWPGGGFPSQQYPGGGLAHLTNGYSPAKQDTYFVLFAGGVNHFDWSNLVCQGQATTQACLDDVVTAQEIEIYARVFLDQYLSGIDSPSLQTTLGLGTSVLPVYYEKSAGSSSVTSLIP